MNEQSKNIGLLLFLIKNPYVLVGLIVIFLIASMLSVVTLLADDNVGLTPESIETIYVNCTEGELDYDIFLEAFEDAGAFTGLGMLFVQVSSMYQIDPVLLTAIAFHETGKGNSTMVRERNNPGGLYNSSTGSFFVFDTLAEGIEAMASNLQRLYISEGLLSISQIGHKYAPIGVANDPNNLNINWIPSVSRIANDLGGLTMNCSMIGGGEFFHPIPNAPITSSFGTRHDPFTGAVSHHLGIDFGCSLGTPIYSANGGQIVVAQNSDSGSYGKHVVINHGEFLTLYAHLSDVSVSVGDLVDLGFPIGLCGSTGRSTGPHLHFEIQLSLYGERIDPMPFFEGR